MNDNTKETELPPILKSITKEVDSGSKQPETTIDVDNIDKTPPENPAPEVDASAVNKKQVPEIPQTPEQQLATARYVIELQMRELAKMFTPDCKLTFIMRKPGNKNASLIVTTDHLQEVFKAVSYLHDVHTKDQEKKLDMQVPKLVV